MRHDPWLERWLPLLRERAAGHPVVELGCGFGADTVTLCEAGFDVLAFDASEAAIGVARTRAPGAAYEVRDVRDVLARDDLGGTRAVLASLSLHYFPWQETVAAFDRIRRLLGPGGVLLCRVNSTQDHRFGASGHPQIEPNFYSVKGEPKRFFDRDTIEDLFARGWHVLSLEHRVTTKYVLPKLVWEVVCEPRAEAGGDPARA